MTDSERVQILTDAVQRAGDVLRLLEQFESSEIAEVKVICRRVADEMRQALNCTLPPH